MQLPRVLSTCLQLPQVLSGCRHCLLRHQLPPSTVDLIICEALAGATIFLANDSWTVEIGLVLAHFSLSFMLSLSFSLSVCLSLPGSADLPAISVGYHYRSSCLESGYGPLGILLQHGIVYKLPSSARPGQAPR